MAVESRIESKAAYAVPALGGAKLYGDDDNRAGVGALAPKSSADPGRSRSAVKPKNTASRTDFGAEDELGQRISVR